MLFVLVVDVLIQVLKMAASNYLISEIGHPNSTARKILSIQYADDTLLMNNVSRYHASILKYIVHAF